MVALPRPQNHTVISIFEALASSRETWDSTGLSISLAGHGCDRYLWLTYRWASPPEALTGQKIRRFMTGDIEEKD